MAEEDLIFGKNRHLFGGLAPSYMKNFSVKAKKTTTGALVAVLTIELPDDTTVKHPSQNYDQVLCTVGGVIIRRSTTDYPKDEFDGDFVCDVTENCEYRDAEIEDGVTYYYKAFPYSKQGVFNRSIVNEVYLKVDSAKLPFYVYGFDIDKDDSNPLTRVTYPKDVDNFEFESVSIDPEDGSYIVERAWKTNAKRTFMPKPCMLRYDGTVAYYLDTTDYTKKDDGTPSDYNNSDFEGNAMLEWPKIYTKRWEENGVYHFRCSDMKLDKDYECWCNYDSNHNEIEHFYTAIYAGRVIDSKLRSIYTAAAPDYELVTDQRASAAGNNTGNADWSMFTMGDHYLIQDLLILMSRTTDKTCKYDLFGGAPELTSTEVWLEKMTAGNTSGAFDLTLNPGEATITVPKPEGGDDSNYYFTSGYVSDTKAYSWGRVPSELNGSSSTYECDGITFYDRSPGAAKCQSYGTIGLGAPNMRKYMNNSMETDDNCAATLSCKPCVTTE